MSIVTLYSSPLSYGPESEETIYDSYGERNQLGFDFGDLETGVDSPTKWLYFRHDGEEVVYDVGVYIRPIGSNWGGYVVSSPDSNAPFNPNMFRDGGVTETGMPKSSTVDYNFVRNQALNDPSKGIRLHLDRENEIIRTSGLGYNNLGLSFNPLQLPVTALDYSKYSGDIIPGVINPAPLDASKLSKVGDEAKIGVSLNISEDVVGSGNVQFAIAIRYRYTS